jgi:hypothetical protein
MAAVAGVEQGGEHRAGEGPGHRQPVDPAVEGEQGHRAAVANCGVRAQVGVPGLVTAGRGGPVGR